MGVTVDPAHRSEKQLVEVDEALIVAAEFHPHHAFYDVTHFLALHPERGVHLAHEGHQACVLDLYTVVIHCEVSPHLLEALCVFLEPRDDIVRVEVVGLKLLNDDEDEQVKHDEGAQYHVGEEEQG